MGLNIRPTSGRIANGSRLIVDGQPTTGVKVFTPSFKYKTSATKDSEFYNHSVNQQTLSTTPPASQNP